MIRLTVHFSGRVQGVGFRYTAHRLAENHRVAGYVQNLHDGRVLLVVEGEGPDINPYISELCRLMSRHIRDTQQVQSPATGEFGPPVPGALGIRH